MGRGAPRKRTCVGCGTVRDMGELVRLVVTEAGEVRASRASNGRGAWLCRQSLHACAQAASRRRRWERAFRRVVPPGAVDEAISLVGDLKRLEPGR